MILKLRAIARAAFVLLLLGALAACPDQTIEGEGSYDLKNNAAVLLPPGHPGVVGGNTMNLPAESSAPLIHYANCFAGVPVTGDVGIGSAAGYTQDFIGTAVLPVNLNLGTQVLGSYTIEVEIVDPSIDVQESSVKGSYSWLSSNNCADRCSPTCVDNPGSYPQQFDRAQGFEIDPTVSNIANGIRIQASDAFPAFPSTGVVNLANIPIKIIGGLPYGGAAVTFRVISLKDSGGANITPVQPLSGVIIENFRIQ